MGGSSLFVGPEESEQVECVEAEGDGEERVQESV